MDKNINVVAALLFLQTVSCWPLIVRYHTDFFLWCADFRICTIFDTVMAITAVCILLSLLAMVFKVRKIAFGIMIIPFFVQAVVICSAALVFIFHRELTAALAMGRLRLVGNALANFLKAPFIWCKRLIVGV